MLSGAELLEGLAVRRIVVVHRANGKRKRYEGMNEEVR
jgi:hypothetical protein